MRFKLYRWCRWLKGGVLGRGKGEEEWERGRGNGGKDCTGEGKDSKRKMRGCFEKGEGEMRKREGRRGKGGCKWED